MNPFFPVYRQNAWRAPAVSTRRGRATKPVHHGQSQPGLRQGLGVDALQPDRVKGVERLEEASSSLAQIAGGRESLGRGVPRKLVAQGERSGACLRSCLGTCDGSITCNRVRGA